MKALVCFLLGHVTWGAAEDRETAGLYRCLRCRRIIEVRP